MPFTAVASAALEASAVETLEVAPHLFRGSEGRSAKTEVLRLTAESVVAVRSIHMPFGGAYDISMVGQESNNIAREALAEALDLAAEFGADLVVVHASGEPIPDGDRSRRLDRARETLAEVGEGCRDRKMRIAVELLPRSCLGNTAAELTDLLAHLDPAVFGV